VKLLSTRARAELWKLQAALRAAARVRNESLPLLLLGRKAVTDDALRELWLEFSCADQEYRHAVAQLSAFVQRHAPGDGEVVDLKSAEFSEPARDS
jgi:hypothetical protein